MAWNYCPTPLSLRDIQEMRAKGMKSLSFIIPQEAKKPFVAPAAQGGLAGLAPSTKTPIQGRMSDREIDQLLVEKAQRGDKHASRCWSSSTSASWRGSF